MEQEICVPFHWGETEWETLGNTKELEILRGVKQELSSFPAVPIFCCPHVFRLRSLLVLSFWGEFNCHLHGNSALLKLIRSEVYETCRISRDECLLATSQFNRRVFWSAVWNKWWQEILKQQHEQGSSTGYLESGSRDKRLRSCRAWDVGVQQVGVAGRREQMSWFIWRTIVMTCDVSFLIQPRLTFALSGLIHVCTDDNKNFLQLQNE